MKAMIRWAISNSSGMNSLLFGVVVLGVFAFSSIRREMLPDLDIDVITVTVPYPGASPEEVEEGICLKIEEEIQGLEGIRKITSCALEGTGTVTLELETAANPQKVLNEVRNAVEKITSFPLLAENKTISLETNRASAIMIGVLAPAGMSAQEFYAVTENELLLRETAENLRNRLMRHPEFKKIDIGGIRDYQVDIEISEQKLREYNLTLKDVARIIRQQNIDIPGGTIRTESQEILVRGKAKKTTGADIADIPLLTTPGGLLLRVRDVGTVRDEFLDTTMIQKINGRPGITLTVSKTKREDIMVMCEKAERFLKEEAPLFLPEGYEVISFGDASKDIGEMLHVLFQNGWQGMLIVFIFLALFLDLKLAVWVAVGVPTAMLGGGIVLFGMDETLNMTSIFAFIMVLGILVDDGIIVGESIYHHRQLGKNFHDAAIDGTAEVAFSVCSSVLTTCIGFAPLLFLPGMMGKFIVIIPTVVIVTLLFSLFESLFLLPVHLSHASEDANEHAGEKPGLFGVAGRFFSYPFSRFYLFTRFCNRHVDTLTQSFIRNAYLPVLRFFLRFPMLFFAAMAALILMTVGLILGGFVKFTAFPEEDAAIVHADITFPDGTPASVTMKAVERIESELGKLNQEYAESGNGTIREVVFSSIGSIDEGSQTGGSNLGRVMVCLTNLSERKVSSKDILNRWRERVGEIPGIETLEFATFDGSPGGKMVELKLLAAPENMPALEAATEEIKRKLEGYDGVYDVASDLRSGKFEYQISMKDKAQSLGITNAELLEQIRPAFYGEEVMRLQRGRHEVKLMVRYPTKERNQPGGLENIKYRFNSGFARKDEHREIPMSELAEVDLKRGYSAINRSGQLRAVTISASADTRKADVTKIVKELRTGFVPELLARPEYRNIDARWEGQFESTNDSFRVLIIGMTAAFLIIYTLLTFEFKSLIQPFIVLFIVPLGLIGAVFGHYVMGLDITLLSFFGLVALAGVVINDSIVLVDCLNRFLDEGMSLRKSLLAVGQRRFRAVFLTSITTIGGISPLMFANSLQTQSLVPLAVSLSFGLIFSTVLVMIMVPVAYSLYRRETGTSKIL